MNKDYSRRDFCKIVGVGALGVLMGTNLAGCGEPEEEKMNLEQLSEYHVFRQPFEDIEGFDTYVFIREQRYLDNYMYFNLNVAEDRMFYDTAFVTLEANNEEMDLDHGKEHIPFKPLLDHFDMVDKGNAVDIVAQELGEKEYYTASEIKQVPGLLKEKEEAKRLVKNK